MKRVYIDSLGLKDGLPVELYSTVIELESAAKLLSAENLAKLEAAQDVIALLSDGAVMNYANRYLAEKGALVDGRDVMSESIEKDFNFPIKTKSVKKEYKDGTSEVVEMPDETEKQHVNRFRAALLSGEVTVTQFARTGNTDKDKALIEDFLQALANTKGPFPVDAAKPERKSGPKVPPKYATEAAATIIKNGTQAKWIGIFQSENVPFEDFTTGESHVNQTRLAWAIKAREDAKAKSEYV